MPAAQPLATHLPLGAKRQKVSSAIVPLHSSSAVALCDCTDVLLRMSQIRSTLSRPAVAAKSPKGW